MKKTLGIIGGMGPLATVKLFEKIVLLTDAPSDQEHLRILIDNNTTIPDRTRYILGNGEDPRPYLIDSIKKLEGIGAEFLIMPCNTAHYFYEDINKYSNIPFINMVEETAKCILEDYKNIKNIGLLATEGTYTGNIYDNVFNKYNLNIIRPSSQCRKYVMDFIYNIKSGIKNIDLSDFNLALDELKSLGTEVFIMGCTELSVALDLYDFEGEFVDPLEIISKRAIEFGGGKVVV